MPATKQQIRQIIADNNLSSVADVYSLLRDSAYYGQRAELIRANDAAVRSKRRKPSVVTWDFSYFYHSVQADRLCGSFCPDMRQHRCCLQTVRTMN